MTEVNRRSFLQGSSAAALGLLSAPAVFADAKSPNEKIRIGVMGTSGRGLALTKGFSSLPNCEVAWVCDVDSRNVGRAQDVATANQSLKPQGTDDFRRILDDQSVDALAIATPDHWHAPAGIMACKAGKHVYVEKPCSHNPREGELFVEAARKYDRRVQMGTQRRSRPGIQEGIRQLHDGVIGDVLYARCHYYNARGSIGNGKPASVPDWLNWKLWQGPAPETEYHDNYVHYNWHWFWKWGTAELGNNGVHYLDVLRWGLNVQTPTTVSCTGGHLRHPDDDQETPDTSIATYNFGDKFIVWEQRSWFKKCPVDSPAAMTFFGSKGSLDITGDAGYTARDMNGKELASGKGETDEKIHFQNFLDSIRGDAKLNCEIEEAHRSTQLCHLGNISYRVGRQLTIDPKTHQIKDDAEAMKLWSREYSKEFEPTV